MIQRDEQNGQPSQITYHGFILDVECDQHAPSHEVIAMKIADALAFVEGCGIVNVGYMGEMENPEEN